MSGLQIKQNTLLSSDSSSLSAGPQAGEWLRNLREAGLATIPESVINVSKASICSTICTMSGSETSSRATVQYAPPPDNPGPSRTAAVHSGRIVRFELTNATAVRAALASRVDAQTLPLMPALPLMTSIDRRVSGIRSDPILAARCCLGFSYRITAQALFGRLDMWWGGWEKRRGGGGTCFSICAQRNRRAAAMEACPD